MIDFLTALAWIWDLLLVVTYFLAARNPEWMFEFNLANFVGGVCLIVYTVAVAAWGTLPLTVAFTLIGLYGVVRHFRRAQAA